MIKGKKIAVTASALMLFVINGWCLNKHPSSMINALAQSVSTDTGKATATNKSDSASVKSTAQHNEVVKTKVDKDTTPMDEMVVMAVTSSGNVSALSNLPNTGTVVSEGAHPKAGWESFNSYLSSNAISPDGKAGEVQLAVLINKMGVITNITVVKGLSTATNQKAINMVNNGSSWIGNDNGKTESVPVQIMFGK